jgi:dTMP kinase
MPRSRPTSPISATRKPIRERIGRFITLEGIEGVGKSTQVARLSAALTERGIEHVVTREPGGTPLAEKIRQLVLQSEGEAVPPSAELLLMFAARAVHLNNLIQPNLKAGRWVICDRFTDATYAYQGGGRGMNMQEIVRLEAMVQGTLRPDLTLLLEAPVAESLQRARKRNADTPTDRFEAERAEFFERVASAYRERAEALPQRMVRIDAAQSAAAVTSSILDVLKQRSWIS